MISISLRDSLEKDKKFVDQLTRLVMESYVRQTWQTEEQVEAYFYKNRFDLPSTKIIQQNGVDIGRISVLYDQREICINNIHILPDYQKKGIGSKIIRQVLDEADRMSLPVVLHVLKTNPVKSLYDALGFSVEEDENYRYYMKRPSNRNSESLKPAA